MVAVTNTLYTEKSSEFFVTLFVYAHIEFTSVKHNVFIMCAYIIGTCTYHEDYFPAD